MKSLNHTPANYIKSDIERYNNNPFTEALPNKLSFDDFFLRVKATPEESLLKADETNEVRKSNLLSLFTDYYVPFDQQYYLYSKFMDVIYEGYAVRTPKKFLEYLNMVKKWDEDEFLSSTESGFLSEVVTRGFSITGHSGSGKTTIISKALNFLPHCIKHEKFSQVPYIKLDCPEKGSTKQICLDFFLELDRKLGHSKYFKLYTQSKWSEYKLVRQMANKVVLHWLGVLVIDEIQTLDSLPTKTAANLLNFFKKLNNTISVPIIFIGTPDASTVFQVNYQQARRTQGVGAFYWSKVAYRSEEWKVLMRSLWKHQVLKKQGELSEEIERQYFFYTRGIIDTLITLHIAVQRWAIDGALEEITPALIEKVAKKELPSTTSLIEHNQKHELQNLNNPYNLNDIKIRVEEDKNTHKKAAKAGQPTGENTQPSIVDTKDLPSTIAVSKLLINAVAECKKSPDCIYLRIEALGYIATNHKDLSLRV